MKQKFLNTFAGNIALTARDKADLLCANLEAIGTIANDQIATMLITRLSRPGSTFIDIGAHIGSIISMALKHNPTAKVIAIEAIPEKVVNLRRKFPSCEIIECAVGESECEVSFYIDTVRSGYSSLQRRNNCREITVQMKRLDRIISALDIDVIKIDVEGAELNVVRGSKKILIQGQPVVMFESATTPSNEEKARLWSEFIDHDYSIFVPNRVAHNGPSLTLGGFIESHFYPRRTTNYFAIPNQRRIEIRDRARVIMDIKTV